MNRNLNLKNVRRLLISVDTVVGFVEQGNMADTFIQRIIPESERLVEMFLHNGDVVVFVKENHTEGCVEFNRFPEHCVQGTEETLMTHRLRKYEEHAIVIGKNCTSAIFAEGFLETINQMANLEEVVIIGCCTDICVLNLAIPLQNYFDQHNKEIKIVVPKNAVETYDAPEHPREEYNEIAFKLLTQMGVELVDKY